MVFFPIIMETKEGKVRRKVLQTLRLRTTRKVFLPLFHFSRDSFSSLADLLKHVVHSKSMLRGLVAKVGDLEELVQDVGQVVKGLQLAVQQQATLQRGIGDKVDAMMDKLGGLEASLAAGKRKKPENAPQNHARAQLKPWLTAYGILLSAPEVAHVLEEVAKATSVDFGTSESNSNFLNHLLYKEFLGGSTGHVQMKSSPAVIQNGDGVGFTFGYVLKGHDGQEFAYTPSQLVLKEDGSPFPLAHGGKNVPPRRILGKPLVALFEPPFWHVSILNDFHRQSI